MFDKLTDRSLVLSLYVRCPGVPTTHLAATMRALAQIGFLDARWLTLHAMTIRSWAKQGKWKDKMPADQRTRRKGRIVEIVVPQDGPEPQLIPNVGDRSFNSLDDELIAVERHAAMRASNDYLAYTAGDGNSRTEETIKVETVLHRNYIRATEVYQKHLNAIRAARLLQDARITELIIAAVRSADPASKEGFQTQVLRYMKSHLVQEGKALYA